MKRKIILNLAVSIDGYISDQDGGFDWIVGQDDNSLNTEIFDFNKFLEQVDTIVMGRNCCDQGFFNDYPEKTVYIATNEELEDRDNLKFIKGDVVKAILDEREKEGKDIYLFGGGILIDAFIKANVIDEYIIATIPTILGGGRPLFWNDNPKIDLHLDKYYVNDGIVVCHYSKKTEE